MANVFVLRKILPNLTCENCKIDSLFFTKLMTSTVNSTSCPSIYVSDKIDHVIHDDALTLGSSCQIALRSSLYVAIEVCGLKNFNSSALQPLVWGRVYP